MAKQVLAPLPELRIETEDDLLVKAVHAEPVRKVRTEARRGVSGVMFATQSRAWTAGGNVD